MWQQSPSGPGPCGRCHHVANGVPRWFSVSAPHFADSVCFSTLQHTMPRKSYPWLSDEHKTEWYKYVSRCSNRQQTPQITLKDNLPAMKATKMHCKLKDHDERCWTCGIVGRDWAKANADGDFICRSCSNKQYQAKREYEADCERKHILKIQCQTCGGTRKLEIHHQHHISPAVAHGILCHQCNLLLAQFGDDPQKGIERFQRMLLLDSTNFGANHYVAKRDGPRFIPYQKLYCQFCDTIIHKHAWKQHIKCNKHLANEKQKLQEDVIALSAAMNDWSFQMESGVWL